MISWQVIDPHTHRIVDGIHNYRGSGDARNFTHAHCAIRTTLRWMLGGEADNFR